MNGYEYRLIVIVTVTFQTLESVNSPSPLLLNTRSRKKKNHTVNVVCRCFFLFFLPSPRIILISSYLINNDSRRT